MDSLTNLFSSDVVWLWMSMAVFLFLIWRGFAAGIIAKLDERSSLIQKRLDEAEKLRVEAQDMLAQYQRKHRDAMSEAEDVIAQAHNRADKIRAQAEAEIADNIRRLQQQSLHRIRRAERRALGDIQDRVIDLATDAIRHAMKDAPDADREKLIKQITKNAIERMPTHIH